MEKNVKMFSERLKEVFNKWKGILDRKTHYHKDVDPP